MGSRPARSARTDGPCSTTSVVSATGNTPKRSETARPRSRRTRRTWKSCARELLAHTFVITDSQIIVESKAKIKKRLRRSPDYSDAVVMAYRPEIEDNAKQEI